GWRPVGGRGPPGGAGGDSGGGGGGRRLAACGRDGRAFRAEPHVRGQHDHGAAGAHRQTHRRASDGGRARALPRVVRGRRRLRLHLPSGGDGPRAATARGGAASGRARRARAEPRVAAAARGRSRGRLGPAAHHDREPRVRWANLPPRVERQDPPGARAAYRAWLRRVPGCGWRDLFAPPCDRPRGGGRALPGRPREPCRVEMPSMERVYRRLGEGGDFSIVAVSIDEQGDSVVMSFARALGLSFDILHDQPAAIKEAYQTTGVPESFLINRDGVIIKKVIGPSEWDGPVNETLIRRLIDDRPR